MTDNNTREFVGAIRWDTIHNAITSEYRRMNNGELMNGWDADACTDAVCFHLRDLNINVLDVPPQAMKYDYRLFPKDLP